MLHRGTSSIWNLGTSAVEVVDIGNSRKLSLCACQVLQRLLQKKTQLNTLVVTDATEMEQVVLTSRPLYLVVVLSRGLLEDPAFTRLCAFTETVEVVNVHADAGFHYPDSAFYDELRAGNVLNFALPIIGEMAIEWVVERYKALFNVLALRFSSHGSSTIQAAEVKAMKKRFRLDKRIDRSQEKAPVADYCLGGSSCVSQQQATGIVLAITPAEHRHDTHWDI